MSRRKKKKFENVEIIDIGDKAHGIGRTSEGEILMVEKVVPGDVVDVETRRKKKSMWWSYPTRYEALSPHRVDAFCQHFENCGGCQWQHLNYEQQLEFKEKKVYDSIRRIAKVEEFEFLPILSASENKYYRNKMEYSFSNKRWLTVEEINSSEVVDNRGGVGLYSAGQHDKVTDVMQCHLQREPGNKIRNFLRSYALENGISFYDTRNHSGFLRQVLVRTSEMNECMVVLSVGEENPELAETILSALQEEVHEISSSFYTYNLKKNNFMYDLDMIHFSGNDHIKERLGHLEFRIAPKSFFQTNTNQGKVLYDTVARFAELSGTENVYDLYSGTGSIGLYLAHQCKSVVGIEEIEMAVEDAAINAETNHISNTRFYHGLVRDILSKEFQSEHGEPDVLITDPPRVGMHPKVIALLLELRSPKIVYVSCNPATQARDIALLSDDYELVKIQAVDMFPHTSHIESVALLKLRSHGN